MRTFEVQTTVVYEPGNSRRHRSLRDCLVAGVYSRGLGQVAQLVDESPSALSEKLSGGSGRKRDVGCDLLETYIAKTGDLTPIFYLVEKYVQDQTVVQQQALAALAALCQELPPLLKAAGAGKVGDEP